MKNRLKFECFFPKNKPAAGIKNQALLMNDWGAFGPNSLLKKFV
jgi:hypothetical protein